MHRRQFFAAAAALTVTPAGKPAAILADAPPPAVRPGIAADTPNLRLAAAYVGHAYATLDRLWDWLADGGRRVRNVPNDPHFNPDEAHGYFWATVADVCAVTAAVKHQLGAPDLPPIDVPAVGDPVNPADLWVGAALLALAVDALDAEVDTHAEHEWCPACLPLQGAAVGLRVMADFLTGELIAFDSDATMDRLKGRLARQLDGGPAKGRRRALAAV